ncbi:MAG: hypothetical protein QGI18_09945 [Candidatus Marinimicrobia bacterium]|nr:hypothetical protein [Candidatus Neomarinimicrobiota bacterium]|tara:strand:+ start:2218 stop:2850 length:633 start_codon:yes stop_codon:yes gene_type:complete
MDNKTVLFFFIILQLTLLYSQNDSVVVDKESSLYILPDNMPLQTKILWSQNGLLRKTKLFNVDRPRELVLRKKMLQLHQKLALGTLGLLFVQGYLGSKLEDAGSNYSKISDNHALLGNIAIGSYFASAMLSYTAPPAIRYNKKIDSIRIHRWLSIIHFSGMIALPYLGKRVSNPNKYNVAYDDALRLHRNTAIMTISSMSLSALITFLPF